MLHTFADDIAPSVSALFNVSIVQGLLPGVNVAIDFIVYFLFLWLDNVA